MSTRILLAACALTSVLALCVSAQSSRGTVAGIVTDPQSAVVPSAAVELVNADTNVKRVTTTNESGLYRFDAVDLGSYHLTVKAQGFQTFVKRAIPVLAGVTASTDVALAIGDTRTLVEITAESESVLQQEAPARGGNWSAANIVELPIAARNPANLALALPGVSTNRFGFGTGGVEGTFTANGSRGRSNNFLINGTENNDISIAGQGMQIKNPDSVAEVAVQTSNFDAEFGRAGGAVVNVITKSGTNNYHGTLHYLLDSTYDDAITNTQSLSPEIQQRGRPLAGTEQWYGGTFGGRIIRDRTFFFGSFQEQRQTSQSTTNLTVPSAAGRARLLQLFPTGRNSLADIYANITSGVTATSQFFNVPLASGRPDIEFGTAITPYAAAFKDRQWMTRIDHRISDSDQISGTLIWSDQNSPQGGATNFFPGFSTAQDNFYRNAVIAHTHTFSPSLTNELRLPYNRIDLRFPNNTENPLGNTLPRYTIAGGVSAIGVQTNLPQGRIANNYSLQDTMTYIRGVHTFRFGADILVQRSRQFAPITERGALDYRASTGFSGFANFLDDFGGSAGSATRDFGSPAYYPELTRQAYFFQDRWRITRDLTLTLGFRYEDFGTPMNSLTKPAFSGLFNIDPVTFDGPYSKPNSVKRDRNNWSPIVGIAYSPSVSGGWMATLLGNKKSVLRAGYQVGYDSFFNNIASNAAVATPNVVSTNVNSIVSAADPRGLARLSASLPLTPRAPSALDSQTLMLDNLVNPYMQRWSFGIQRELPQSMIADISYVGSSGTRLFINEDLNPLVPVSLRIAPSSAPASRLSSRLDNLQGPRTTRTNGGHSSYHSLQMSLNRRFRSGVAFTGSYTWSKSIDNASEVFAVAATGAASVSAVPSIFGGQATERALSFFHRAHRGVFTALYELPFFKQQQGVLGHVAGGWQLSGVAVFESGVPMNVTNGVDADGLGGNNDRPMFNPNGTPGVRAVFRAGTSTGYVNPDNNNAVIDPATAAYISLPAHSGNVPLPTGNLGRNTLFTPGIANYNLNAQKTIKVFEGLSLQLRGEFFNLFNHPQYGTPSVSPFSPGQQGLQTIVATAPSGRFLQPQFADGGGRVLRYQIKLIF